MNSRLSIVAGWILAIPGFLMLLSLLLVATPIFGAIGCRTSGFLSIRCSNELVGSVMEGFWIVLILSAAYVEFAAPVGLFAIGFVGWRILIAVRRRRAAGD